MVQLLAGDSVVVGTDGLFDNLSEKLTATLVAMYKQEGDNCHVIAKKLAEQAGITAHQTFGVTPFAAEALKHNKVWAGGKLDDITVLVAEVS